ncbi:hypothetical protein ACJX0J_011951, partial [Zea mays]
IFVTGMPTTLFLIFTMYSFKARVSLYLYNLVFTAIHKEKHKHIQFNSEIQEKPKETYICDHKKLPNPNSGNSWENDVRAAVWSVSEARILAVKWKTKIDRIPFILFLYQVADFSAHFALLPYKPGSKGGFLREDPLPEMKIFEIILKIIVQNILFTINLIKFELVIRMVQSYTKHVHNVFVVDIAGII